MTARTCLTGLLLAASLGTAGCDPATPPALAPVSGLVTYRGVPLPGGLIVFTPDAESGCHGPSAQGAIGPDGRYTLTTDAAPGAPPGKHRVTVAGRGFPDRFRDPQLSGLLAEVAVGRDNVLDFRLEDR
jgi:hypothetical protein